MNANAISIHRDGDELRAFCRAKLAAAVKFVAGHDSLRIFPVDLVIQIENFLLNPALYGGAPMKHASEYTEFWGKWQDIWLEFKDSSAHPLPAWAVFQYDQLNWVFVVQRDPEGRSEETSSSHMPQPMIIVPDPYADNDALIKASSRKRHWKVWHKEDQDKISLTGFIRPSRDVPANLRRTTYIDRRNGKAVTGPSASDEIFNPQTGQVDTNGGLSETSEPGRRKQVTSLSSRGAFLTTRLFVTLKYETPARHHNGLSFRTTQAKSAGIPDMVHRKDPSQKRLSSCNDNSPVSKKPRRSTTEPKGAKNRSSLKRTSTRKDVTAIGSKENVTNSTLKADKPVCDEMQEQHSPTESTTAMTRPGTSDQVAHSAPEMDNSQVTDSTSAIPDAVVPALELHGSLDSNNGKATDTVSSTLNDTMPSSELRTQLDPDSNHTTNTTSAIHEIGVPSSEVQVELGHDDMKSKNEEPSSTNAELSNRPVVFCFKKSATDPKPRVRPNAVVNNVYRLFMHASCSKVLSRGVEILSVQVGDDLGQQFNIMKDDEEDYLRIIKALNQQQNGGSETLVVTVMPAKI